MDADAADELLVSHHQFPGTYRIKAIGSNTGDFPARVVAAAAEELAGPGEIESEVRETTGGRHVSVTLDLNVQSPEQVRAVYARLRQVEGLSMIL